MKERKIVVDGQSKIQKIYKSKEVLNFANDSIKKTNEKFNLNLPKLDTNKRCGYWTCSIANIWHFYPPKEGISKEALIKKVEYANKIIKCFNMSTDGSKQEKKEILSRYNERFN